MYIIISIQLKKKNYFIICYSFLKYGPFWSFILSGIQGVSLKKQICRITSAIKLLLVAKFPEDN